MTDSAMFETRIVLNGFPKAGIHLLEAHIAPVAQKLQGDRSMHKGWTGTHRGNSFGAETYPLEQVGYQLSRLRDGQYMKAHMAWSIELATYMHMAGHIHLFLYRDLRDVAVSQAFHILNPADHAKHPAKEQFKDADFDDVLSFVIVGNDEYPGVVERWAEYASWLGFGDLLPIRYEELRAKPRANCDRILDYAMRYLPERFNHRSRVRPKVFRQLVERMVAGNRRPEQSSTFRKGKVGEWQKHFTDKHIDEFARMGGMAELKGMGYA